MSDKPDTTPIDDTVIEALRAQSRRYDVAIDDDMVLSVLPNGVKTWTWVYENHADSQRKTLGIYPDMSLEDAKKSLASEKAAYRHASGEQPGSDFVIRDGRIQPANLSSSKIVYAVGAIAVVLTVVFLAWLLLGNDEDAPPVAAERDTDVTSPAPESGSAASMTAGLPAGSDGDAGGTSTTEPTPSIGADAAAGIATTADEISAEVASQVASINERLEAELERLRSLEDPTTNSAAIVTTEQSDANAAATNPPAITATEEPAISDNAAPSVATRTTPAAGSTASDSAEVRPIVNQREGPQPQPQPAPAGVSAQTDDDAGPADLLLDARIARGLLTSAVVQREPVDDLGGRIVGNGEDLQTYYFYTELRQLSGQRIRHRWVQGDRVIAEVPFDVGEAWRWRVFSSKTFLRSMAGSWRVQVVLDDDTVIYNLPFTYSP